MNGETLATAGAARPKHAYAAYDRSEQASSETADEPSVGIVVNSPSPDRSQTFQTLSLRGDISLQPKLLLNLSDYQLNYLSHYSIDGGITLNDSSHSYNEPRAALTWQPNNDTSYRLSTGGSIAPPYISLVSSGGPTWSQIIGGVPSAGWIQNANNGNINAETALGYDLGMDHRIARATSVSVDLYYTQLHNLFLDLDVVRSPVTPLRAVRVWPIAPCVRLGDREPRPGALRRHRVRAQSRAGVRLRMETARLAAARLHL